MSRGERAVTGLNATQGSLLGFLHDGRREHEQRLDLYRAVAAHVPAADPHTAAVVAFGLAYEQAILGWLDDLRVPAGVRPSGARLGRSTAPPVAVAVRFVECVN